MSHRNRIVIAAAALSTLLLASPSPSYAAGLWEGRLPGIGALEQAWNWVRGFFWDGDEADGTTAVWEKEGGAVNPNGQPNSAPTPPATTAQEDPDS